MIFSGSVFIFIFEVGAEQLSALTLDLLEKGERREIFNIQQFRDIIKNAMLEKGFYYFFINFLSKFG